MRGPETRRALFGLLWAAAATTGAGRAARAQPFRHPAVPPPRFERPPGPPPRRGLRWRPGHWQWTGRGYVWVPGTWVARPGGRGTYRAGRWVFRNGAWVWAPGRWY
jgi:hypothetical protein